MTRTLGPDLRQRRTHQNTSVNALRRVRTVTHQTTQLNVKRPHKTMSMASGNVPEMIETSTSTQGTPQVKIDPLKVIEASMGSREVSRSIRTAEMSSKVLNSMG